MRTTVIFACIHNAGRSQMAAAFFNRMVDEEMAAALSAGTQPADRVHAVVATAMAEIGFDLSGVKPRKLTPELAAGAGWLVTMGCGEECGVVPGAQHLDWPLADPKGASLDAVREVRDEVAQRVRGFIEDRGWSKVR